MDFVRSIGIRKCAHNLLHKLEESTDGYLPIDLLFASDETAGPNILLAEDDPEMGLFIARLLRRICATVTTVGSGTDALECVLFAERHGFSYDLVLMDVNLPALDGLSAARKLRLSGYCQPIIALSGTASFSLLTSSMEAGCDCFLNKAHLYRRLNAAVLELMI